MSTPPTQVPADDPTPTEPSSIFDDFGEVPADGVGIIDEATVPLDRPEVEIGDDGKIKFRVDTGDIDPYDHSAEQNARHEHESKMGTAPPPMPETSEEPIRNKAVMHDATDALKEEMERRFSQEFGDLTVEVTQQERDAFVRSALHDGEFLMDIPLEGVQATVTVALPPDAFTNSAAAAVKRWGKEGYIDADSDLQWILAFQQIHAWYQVRAINGEPTEWSDYWAGGIPSMRDVREQMNDIKVFDPIINMGAVRWRMILDAIRIAELKYKICLQNWKDRSFFGGADTD